MIKVLIGNNAFGLKRATSELIDKFIGEHGELSIERLDGEENSYEQIMAAVESVPFLSSKKMVILRDLSKNNEAVEKIEYIFERKPDSTELVILEDKPDKRSSFYKTLKKCTEFIELNELNEDALASWLIDEAKRLGGELLKSDALYLVRRCGMNQMKLSRELEKLINYNSMITKENIDLLTAEMPSSTIFNLIDNIFSGNTAKAMQIYEQQRQLRVEPQAIHGMFVWQMHIVAMVSTMPSSMTPGDIAKECGLSPYVVQKSQNIARRMGRSKIAGFIDLLNEIDLRSKTEALNYDDALKYAILRLAA